MDFTREPIIETIITPRDGCKIVVRSSKTLGQEEHFVDAVEVISFGGATFFRSQERPKAFLVPASDYEVLEVREARVVLKNVGLDRSIKIAGGRDSNMKGSKEDKTHKEDRREDKRVERAESSESSKESADKVIEAKLSETKAADQKGQDAKPDSRNGRRDRRRGRGRRRGDADENSPEGTKEGKSEQEGDYSTEEENSSSSQSSGSVQDQERVINPILSSLLTPPPTLISETLHRYRDNALFQSAFYTKEELETAGPEFSAETPESSFFEEPIKENEPAHTPEQLHDVAATEALAESLIQGVLDQVHFDDSPIMPGAEISNDLVEPESVTIIKEEVIVEEIESVDLTNKENAIKNDTI